jgi:hypothetical protein
MPNEPAHSPGQPGIGVDARGGAVIDPTKNVLDLVQAESKFQNGMREAGEKYQNALREAESKRVDDLALQKERYEKQISDILTVQAKTTSELISTQLDKVTTSLAAQIATVSSSLAGQIVSLNSAVDARLTPIERFRYETGGRTSVSDPATAQAIENLSTAVRRLSAADDLHEGSRRSIGVSGMVVVQVISSIASTAAVIGVIALLLGHHS